MFALKHSKYLIIISFSRAVFIDFYQFWKRLLALDFTYRYNEVKLILMWMWYLLICGRLTSEVLCRILRLWNIFASFMFPFVSIVGLTFRPFFVGWLKGSRIITKIWNSLFFYRLLRQDHSTSKIVWHAF